MQIQSPSTELQMVQSAKPGWDLQMVLAYELQSAKQHSGCVGKKWLARLKFVSIFIL